MKASIARGLVLWVFGAALLGSSVYALDLPTSGQTASVHGSTPRNTRSTSQVPFEFSFSGTRGDQPTLSERVAHFSRDFRLDLEQFRRPWQIPLVASNAPKRPAGHFWFGASPSLPAYPPLLFAPLPGPGRIIPRGDGFLVEPNGLRR